MTRERLKLGLAILLALGLAGAAIVLWQTDLDRVLGEPEAFQKFVLNLGVWGPAAVFTAQVLQVLLAPVPGQIIGLAAGYLYGVWWGTLLALFGLTVGTGLAIWLARRLGRPLVERVAQPKTLNRIDGLAERHGVWAFFLIFLLPFFPDDISCFIAGLTPIRLRKLVLVAILGRLPGLAISTWIGASSQQVSWAVIAIAAGLALLLAGIIVYYRDRLREAMFRFMEELGFD